MPYKNPEDRRAWARAHARPNSSYVRDRYKKRRDAWFSENGPCHKCGSWANLEVDHIDPSTKISSKFWGWSTERREAELAKCQALCRPCHIDKTVTQNENKGVRQVRGSQVFGSRLTAEIVRALRERHSHGESMLSLSKEFGVACSSVRKAILRKSWAHIE
jgi:hypothetical protein